MKQLIMLFFIAFSLQAVAQPKIKILLIGTIHFDPSKTDLVKNEKIDLTDPKRQEELNDMLKQLAALHPNIICVENTPGEQSMIDSGYTLYKTGNYKMNPRIKDEVEQIAFGLAAKCNLKMITCVNNLVELDYERLQKTADSCHQTYMLDSVTSAGESLIKKINSVFASRPLKEAFKFINDPLILRENLQLYLKYLSSIGCGTAYNGNFLIADWYRRNLNIYQNICKAIGPAEKLVVVLFGQGHIPILRHFFENNDEFSVINLSDVLH